jgi:hypothetical protein
MIAVVKSPEPKIIKGFPPNYAQICQAIPGVKSRPTIIFTYAPNIYVPSGNPLPDHLLEHEKVHVQEQLHMGVEAWWDQYLKQPRFRLEQELLAYRTQYGVLQQNYNRAFRKAVLQKIAKDLSGEMYGGIVTTHKAVGLITGNEEL